MQSSATRKLPRGASDTLFSPSLRDAVKTDLAPLTVIRAPRGYGKTSLISTWLALDLPIELVDYVALPKRCRDAEQFWAVLCEEVFGAPGLSIDGFAELVAGDGRKRLVVLDDYQYAGVEGDVAEFDEELVELVRRFENLFVIVSTRLNRPIETLAAMALPTLTVGPAELAFTPERLQFLADSLGVRVSRGKALSLTEGVGGWPALLRASVSQARIVGGEPSLDLNTLISHLEVVLTDVNSSHLRTFLLRASVAEVITAELARALSDDGSGPQHVRSAYGLGLLRQVAESGDYEFPSAIRRALLEVMRMESPADAHEAEFVLRATQGGTQDPIQRLQHAVDIDDWDGAVEVLQEEFLALVTQNPQVTYGLVKKLPTEVMRTSAHAHVVLQEVLGAPEVDDNYWLWSADNDFWQVEELLGTPKPEVGEFHEETVLLLWGFGNIASGQLDTAVYVLNRCWSRTDGAPEKAAHAQTAAATLAAIHAYQGATHQAEAWLTERRELNESAPTSSTPFAEAAAAFAEAMLRVDAGEPEAGIMLEQIPVLRSRGLVSALINFARARHAVVHLDEPRMMSLVNELRSAVRYTPRGSVSETILINALIELVIAADMLPIARELAERLGPADAATISHARLALAQNDFGEAIRSASQVHDSLTQYPRLEIERDVILASAAHGLGDFPTAQKYFERALQAIQTSGQTRALTILPFYIFVVLAQGREGVLSLWPSKERSTQFVRELTPREVQILRALIRLSGPSAVAEHLELSVNTVKTHVQAIYRKLGVTSRADAIARIR